MKMRILKGGSYAVVFAALAAAPFLVSSYHLSLLGRFLAVSVLALGLVLVWGRGGILSLGQGVFFGLGGYALAMHLKLVALAPGDLPDFMVWSGLEKLPWWWSLFSRSSIGLAAVILVPTVTAAGFAWLVFHRGVGGVYFALITQALALAFATLLISQQPYTGGFNGLTDFSTLLGYELNEPRVQRGLYWVTLGVLVLSFAFAQWLLSTNFGRILQAIRDGENRIRFLGYNPSPFKIVVFALGGAYAGLAGALFTLHVGVISPAMIGVVASIEMVIWVAVGGRSSLLGAVVGTLLVNFGKDWISSAMPELWLVVVGFLFVGVVLILPEGLAGMPELWRRLQPRLENFLSRFAAGPKRRKPEEPVPAPVLEPGGAE